MSIKDLFRESREVFFLVECDFNGLIKRFSTKDIQISSTVFFEGKITSIGSAGTSLNLRTFILSSNNIAASIINDDRFQDHEALRVLDGSLCKVYVYCDGMTWAQVLANCLLFTGSFKKEYHTATSYAFTIEDIKARRFRTVPPSFITSDTFPTHRTEAGGGSVSGKAMPLVFGDHARGIPLQCIHTTDFKYLASIGQIKSVDGDYTATTENVYDKDGAVVAAAGYSLADSITEGQPYTYFDFAGDQVASENLSCSMRGIKDTGGEVTGTVDLLIEHPAHIARYLIEKYGIGILPDLSSLGTMKNDLPHFKFASYINSAANAGDVIQRFFSQCQASLMERNGKHGVVVYNADRVATQRLVKKHHHIGGEISISKTNIDNVCNHLMVNYNLHISSGKYESQVVYDRTNNEACKQSYYQYGERPAVVLNLPDVNLQAIAEQVGKRYLSFHSHRHDVVSLLVGYGDAFDIVEADAALWTIPEGASVDGNGWVDERCILLDRAFTRNGIQQKWWRVNT